MTSFTPESYAPPSYVEAPPRKQLPNGLFDSVEWITSAQGEHWRNGILWDALASFAASGVGSDVKFGAGGLSVGTGLPKNFPFSPVSGSASSFVVYAPYRVSAMGHPDDYSLQRATQLLQAREQARVEQALWTGDLTGAGTGMEATADSLGTDFAEPADALAALEEWIGNVYGSEGSIHVTRAMATRLANGFLIENTPTGLRTIVGTKLVVGAGYTPAAENKMIATPALFGLRSDIYESQGDVIILDKDKNDIYGLVERAYVIGYDPVGCALVQVAG